MAERVNVSDCKVVPRKRRHPDRITLQPGHLQKLDTWVRQICDTNRGVSLNRTQLVGWLIDNWPAELSATQMGALSKLFYDDERFLREALRQIKMLRANGEKVDIQSILDSPQSKRRPKARTLKSAKRLESDLELNTSGS